MILLLLQAFFLWAIVSVLMVGGAAVFHRYFPEESPWFGFIVPPLALVLLLNFIEHAVAVPKMVFLLPVLGGGAIWLLGVKGWFKPALWLPTGVFLVAFAFTFAVRCATPNIAYTSDGISDLNMVNTYFQGGTLPPVDAWLPPYPFEWYYGLQHYAASVVGRLLDVRVGVATNVSHALLSALICMAGAGAAHRISGGRTWVTLTVPFLIESSFTGSSLYLLTTMKSLEVWLPFDLSDGVIHRPENLALWDLLKWDLRPAVHDATLETIGQSRILRLQVPGFWTWRDEYHANASGHLLSLLSVLVVAELTHVRRTLWPWVLGAIIPLLAICASAWALPITMLVCWVALPLAWFHGRRPVASGLTALVLTIAVALIWPYFYAISSSPLSLEITWTDPALYVPMFEFLIQWWPVWTLWICGWVYWRELSFGLRWIMFVAPIMLIFIDLVTIESRYNMVEKMWGYTWGVTFYALFPFVATRPLGVCRLLVMALIISACVSLYAFSWSVIHWDMPNVRVFHLNGDDYLATDKQKRKIMDVINQTKGATYLSGKSAWCYNESPAPMVFTGNRCYSAWCFYESRVNYESEALRRSDLNNHFYDGTLPNRLRFLQDNRITGVLIWPGDEITDEALEALRKDIDSAYEYIDCKGDGEHNAGMFMLRGSVGQAGAALR